MTGTIEVGQWKWESLKKRRKDNRLISLYKGLKGKTSGADWRSGDPVVKPRTLAERSRVRGPQSPFFVALSKSHTHSFWGNDQKCIVSVTCKKKKPEYLRMTSFPEISTFRPFRHRGQSSFIIYVIPHTLSNKLLL